MTTDERSAEQSAEAQVRAYWTLTHRCDGSYREYPRGIVLVQQLHGQWTEFDSWDAALAFTLEHQRKVAELEEEIASVNFHIGMMSAENGPMSYPPSWDRILARLQAALSEHQRGVKEKA